MQTIALLIVGAIVVAAILLWPKQDGKEEERRRVAFEVAQKLEEIGLGALSDLFEDFAVGDYAAFAAGVVSLRRKLANSANYQDLIKRLAEQSSKKHIEANPTERQNFLQLVGDHCAHCSKREQPAGPEGRDG